MGKNENEVKNNLFGFGKLNTQYADVFIGNSYLNSLVSKDDNIDVGVSNVNFEPVVEIIGTFTIMVFKFCWSRLVKVGIRKKAKRPSCLNLVMWLQFMKV